MLVARNDEITLDEIERLGPARICISPGPCTPNEAGVSLGVLERFAGRVAILGVCLRHQAMGQALKWIIRQKRMINAHDAKAMARRVETFDSSANLFISNNPKSTVINIGCGFDTRFWRIEKKECRYVEIDLPEVIALKREILKDQLGYELIGCSILDPSWIDKVITNGNSNFLLLAEGLFMFLSMQDVKNLLQLLAQKLVHSQLVVEMAHEKWTKGFWKMIFALQAKVWGLDVSFASGIKNPRDIESYGTGLKVLGDVKGSSVGPIVVVSINAT